MIRPTEQPFSSLSATTEDLQSPQQVTATMVISLITIGTQSSLFRFTSMAYRQVAPRPPYLIIVVVLSLDF